VDGRRNHPTRRISQPSRRTPPRQNSEPTTKSAFAALQMRAPLGQVEATGRSISGQLCQAAARGLELVVFPEFA